MKCLAGLLALAGWCLWAPAAAQPAAAAQAPDVHQHDLARLRVVVENDLLNLWLRAPLDSLVGFEAAPRSGRQRQAVKELAARLHQPQSLFVPADAAACVPVTVALASEVLAPALLAAPPLATPAAAATVTAGPGRTEPGAATVTTPATPAGRVPVAGNHASGHADLEATISFRCGKPQALTGLQVRLFDAFPGLGRIDVDIVTPRGQSGARLSPKRASLTW